MSITNKIYQNLNESVNQENSEINAKILNALKTKAGTEPKYIDDLEAVGIKIDQDAKHDSTQGYITLIGPNGRKLAISKNNDNRTALFDPWSQKVVMEDFTKFDYLTYFTTGKEPAGEYRNNRDRKYQKKMPSIDSYQRAKEHERDQKEVYGVHYHIPKYYGTGTEYRSTNNPEETIAALEKAIEEIRTNAAESKTKADDYAKQAKDIVTKRREELGGK